MDTEQIRSANVKAAALSIASNVFIVALETTGGILTGSVSILAGAIDSMINLAASVIAFFSVRLSAKPADQEHPFGHGKVENIAGTVEAGLIFLAAGLIIYEAVRRMFEGVELALTELGMAIMACSILVNSLVSRHLIRVAQKTDSLAIEGDARHLVADIMTSVAILLGLAAVRLTGIKFLDPLVAIAVALYIMKTAYGLTRKSFGGLVDVRLPAEEEKIVSSCIMEHFGELIGFHELRTRKAGPHRYIELHLVMSRTSSLEEVHRMCDHLEADIKKKLPHTSVTIHVEPCETDCKDCDIACPVEDSKTGKRR